MTSRRGRRGERACAQRVGLGQCTSPTIVSGPPSTRVECSGRQPSRMLPPRSINVRLTVHRSECRTIASCAPHLPRLRDHRAPTPVTANHAALLNACYTRGQSQSSVDRVEVNRPRVAARRPARGVRAGPHLQRGRRAARQDAGARSTRALRELGIPYTGSDSYTLCVTLDKAMTSDPRGLRHPDPRGRLVTRESLRAGGLDDFVFPVIAKPNFEGSSKGISQRSVADDAVELGKTLDDLLAKYPEGVLVERYVQGMDVRVVRLDGGPKLGPVEMSVDPTYPRRFEILDYALKHEDERFVTRPDAPALACADPRTARRPGDTRLRRARHARRGGPSTSASSVTERSTSSAPRRCRASSPTRRCSSRPPPRASTTTRRSTRSSGRRAPARASRRFSTPRSRGRRGAARRCAWGSRST